MPIIAEAYQPAPEDSQEVYAFERHLDGQNSWYSIILWKWSRSSDSKTASRARALVNYENVELSEKILKPYQTLAILV